MAIIRSISLDQKHIDIIKKYNVKLSKKVQKMLEEIDVHHKWFSQSYPKMSDKDVLNFANEAVRRGLFPKPETKTNYLVEMVGTKSAEKIEHIDETQQLKKEIERLEMEFETHSPSK